MNGLVKLPEGDTQRMVEICALKTAHIACKGAMEELPPYLTIMKRSWGRFGTLAVLHPTLDSESNGLWCASGISILVSKRMYADIA